MHEVIQDHALYIYINEDLPLYILFMLLEVAVSPLE